MQGELWRVKGKLRQANWNGGFYWTGVTTHVYQSKAAAMDRAKKYAKHGELIEFSKGTVEWLPIDPSEVK